MILPWKHKCPKCGNEEECLRNPEEQYLEGFNHMCLKCRYEWNESK